MGKILNSKEIGWRLRTMRQRAGYTQERLAEAIGLTAQQVQKYECGSSKLNTDRLQQLSHLFNTPIQAFFEITDDALPLDVSERMLLDSYRDISNKEIQESLLKLALHASKVQE